MAQFILTLGTTVLLAWAILGVFLYFFLPLLTQSPRDVFSRWRR